jgi:hypothetical protein
MADEKVAKSLDQRVSDLLSTYYSHFLVILSWILLRQIIMMTPRLMRSCAPPSVSLVNDLPYFFEPLTSVSIYPNV